MCVCVLISVEQCRCIRLRFCGREFCPSSCLSAATSFRFVSLIRSVLIIVFVSRSHTCETKARSLANCRKKPSPFHSLVKSEQLKVKPDTPNDERHTNKFSLNYRFNGKFSVTFFPSIEIFF